MAVPFGQVFPALRGPTPRMARFAPPVQLEAFPMPPPQLAWTLARGVQRAPIRSYLAQILRPSARDVLRGPSAPLDPVLVILR